LPLNSRGRSRVLAFRLTNDDIEIVRHLTGTASCVRLISRRSSASLDRVNDHLTKRMDSLRELRVGRSSDTQLFLFAMRAYVRATGPLAHAWRDGDGHAQSTVRSVNVGSYPGSARLIAAQRIGEECQKTT
jgi:hypothetical protein